MARELAIKIVVENGKAKQQLVEVDDSIKGVKKSADDASTSTATLQTGLGKLVQAAGGLIAIEEGTRRLIDFAKESVKAMSEQENATVKLTTALKAQGTATPELLARYIELSSQFQHTTVFADELVQGMEALLVQVGNVMPNQMKAALTAATDLSAGLGIDLRTATLLVGKAFEGETGTLKRYGIVIDDLKNSGDKTGAVLDAIHAKFGGQAQAQMETYSGKVTNLSNRWNDFQERVGLLVIRVVEPLLNIFEKMPEAVQTVAFGLGSLTVTLAPLAAGAQLVLMAFGSSLMTAFTTLAGFVSASVIPLFAEALPVALNALVALLTPPAGWVIAGITAVVVAWRNWDTIKDIVARVYSAVKEWLVDKFAQLVQWIGDKVHAVTGFFKDMYESVVGHSYVPDMMKGIQREFAQLPAIMLEPTNLTVSAVIDSFKKLGEMFTPSGVFHMILSSGLSALFGPGGLVSGLFQKGMEELGQLAWSGLKKIGGFFKDLFTGPSAQELAGRDVVANFEANLAKMLTDGQIVEAGNESWKMTVIAVRDAYIAMGRTEQEALDDVKKLWESSKQGPAAVAAIIDEITGKMHELTDAANDAASAIAGIGPGDRGGRDAEQFHTGGVVGMSAWPRAHRGLAIDEVPIVALRGEGVLNRGAMRSIGGAAGLNALNSGARGGSGVAVTINGLTIEQGMSERDAEELIGKTVMQAIRRRGIRVG